MLQCLWRLWSLFSRSPASCRIAPEFTPVGQVDPVRFAVSRHQQFARPSQVWNTLPIQGHSELGGLHTCSSKSHAPTKKQSFWTNDAGCSKLYGLALENERRIGTRSVSFARLFNADMCNPSIQAIQMVPGSELCGNSLCSACSPTKSCKQCWWRFHGHG